jgi:hypothetical protein
MDSNRTALERAFDLANSGACDTVEDIKRCLRQEGYVDTQVIGKSLRKQLRALIDEARETPMPKGPESSEAPY